MAQPQASVVESGQLLSRIVDLFRVSRPASQRMYVTTGLILAAIKYSIEFLSVWLATGRFYSPMDFVNPWLSSKAPFLIDAPGMGLIWLLFTVPFVWIAVAMSVRRAADVGISPWTGLFILIPIVNLVAIFILSLLPTGLFFRTPEQQAEDELNRKQIAVAYQAPAVESWDPVGRAVSPIYRPWIAIAMGCITQVVAGIVSVWIYDTYGFILFFASPVIAGAVTGFVHHFGERRSVASTMALIVLMNVFAFFLMLMIGLDGAICLIMAYPLLGPLSIVGGLIGMAVATSDLRPGVDERPGMYGSIVMLPLCLGIESFDNQNPLHSVTTSIEIAATPEVVWEKVIAFPEIDTPMAWYFRAGIAAPLHATIDGSGVGAIRHCNFTTGSFVEPITAWEPGRRLAFDVASQPAPMHEWTPFSNLHPQHLDTGFMSRRGEFLIEALPDGKTRLQGTTWYEINVRPRLYWKCLADPLLHAVHNRVLQHIARQATASELAPTTAMTLGYDSNHDAHHH